MDGITEKPVASAKEAFDVSLLSELYVTMCVLDLSTDCSSNSRNRICYFTWGVPAGNSLLHGTLDGLLCLCLLHCLVPVQVLSGGWSNRRVAATSMNRESSRSHAVFTLTVESKVKVSEVRQVFGFFWMYLCVPSVCGHACLIV